MTLDQHLQKVAIDTAAELAAADDPEVAASRFIFLLLRSLEEVNAKALEELVLMRPPGLPTAP